MSRDRRIALREKVMAPFLWLGLVVATVAVLASGWDHVGDVRGATVDAQVVSIKTNVVGRRVYDIRLVTHSGRTCVTLVDSGSNPQPRDIRVGATSRVHYSANNTCADYSVRESTDSSTRAIGSGLVVRPVQRAPEVAAIS